MDNRLRGGKFGELGREFGDGGVGEDVRVGDRGELDRVLARGVDGRGNTGVPRGEVDLGKL